MKITDPQVIKNGENDLIASVQKNLDPETVKKIIADQIAQTALMPKGGQIVVHDNQVAFRMDFDLQMRGSILFDRQGNYITDTPHHRTASEDPENAPISLETPDARPLQSDAGEDLSRTALDQEPLDQEALDQEPEEDTEPVSLEGLETDLDDSDMDDLDDPHTEDTDLGRDDLDDDSLEFGSLDLEEDNDQNAKMDDDIDDILKESRDFWKEKKGS
ncbi:MAG TPA: hypothetical protein VJ943_05275 [Desulfotignum sp.]|nr:hypothetical protein [Desulfotignum sp.]